MILKDTFSWVFVWTYSLNDLILSCLLKISLFFAGSLFHHKLKWHFLFVLALSEQFIIKVHEKGSVEEYFCSVDSDLRLFVV